MTLPDRPSEIPEKPDGPANDTGINPSQGRAPNPHDAQPHAPRVRGMMSAAAEKKLAARKKAQAVRLQAKQDGYATITRKVPEAAVSAVDVLLRRLREEHEAALKMRMARARPLSALEQAMHDIGKQISFEAETGPDGDQRTMRIVMSTVEDEDDDTYEQSFRNDSLDGLSDEDIDDLARSLGVNVDE